VVEFPELLYRQLAQLLTDAAAAPDRAAADAVLQYPVQLLLSR
jgi:hypothetical protein